MRKCAIIINDMSGNIARVDGDMLTSVFGGGFEVEVFHLKRRTVFKNVSKYDRIVLCGGDGTLNGIINCKKREDAEIFYCPYGTLNELATGNSQEADYLLPDVGRAGDKLFSYVFACGIFTPLGYIVKNKHKQKFKALAYITKVIGQYKLYNIGAKLNVDGKTYDGNYTLIMAIDSPKCFGFNFNKMFKLDDGRLHLLTIAAPKHKGLLGKIRVFFPLFRAFFIGFKKPYRSKMMFFDEFKHLNVELRQDTAFCADGEKVDMSGTFDIEPTRLATPIRIIAQSEIEKMAKHGLSL
ncbi:MAG: hypothetical protein K2J16_01305 [Clostridia bacterium]|nr:hypothetical protein [Clostridia bacterium]